MNATPRIGFGGLGVIMATPEGLIIGTRFGLDPEVMTDVLNVSTGISEVVRRLEGTTGTQISTQRL